MATITISNVSTSVNITQLSAVLMDLIRKELGQDAELTMHLDDSDIPGFNDSTGNSEHDGWEDDAILPPSTNITLEYLMQDPRIEYCEKIEKEGQQVAKIGKDDTQTIGGYGQPNEPIHGNELYPEVSIGDCFFLTVNNEFFNPEIVDFLNNDVVIAIRKGIVGLYRKPSFKPWETLYEFDYKSERVALVDAIVYICNRFHEQ